MEAIRQYVRVPKNHKIQITVPEYIDSEELAEVIVIVGNKSKKEKIKNMERAMKDPMFVADMNKINEDFKFIDSEEW